MLKGAAVGALAGGAIGAITKNKHKSSSHRTKRGLLKGAAIGALAGGAIGAITKKKHHH